MLDAMTQIEILKKRFMRQKPSSWVAPPECRQQQVSTSII